MNLVKDINTVYKKLQGYSTGQCFLVPKRWCKSMGWKNAYFRAELLPAREMIILTKLSDEEVKKLVGIKVLRMAENDADELDELDSNEKVSDIVTIPDWIC